MDSFLFGERNQNGPTDRTKRFSIISTKVDFDEMVGRELYIILFLIIIIIHSFFFSFYGPSFSAKIKFKENLSKVKSGQNLFVN